MASAPEKPHPRKLVKRNKTKKQDGALHFPPHLQEGDDVDTDVTAASTNRPQYMHLNQSMLSLLTAAGSKKDFHSRYDEDESSGSESEHGAAHEDAGAEGTLSEGETGAQHMVTSTEGEAKSADATTADSGRRLRSQSALRRSLPKLNIRNRKERNYMAHSMILPPKGRVGLGLSESPTSTTPRDAPVLTRMLEAQAQLSGPLEEDGRDQSDVVQQYASPLDETSTDAGSLKTRLQEIFGFETAEDVLSEYPAWLLQSVLLQGYLYITEKHLAFYAYLPKRSSVIAKSGYLSKKGKQSPKFTRYWFTLKGDVFSYYSDPSNVYFPRGNIDLRYGVAAALQETSKDRSKECNFTVSTHNRTYFFRADSPSSAREWVKTLQKVIFRSHNDGDSVKISLPIANIIDIEESPVVDFADTVKIRVFDNDDTYAIDEYFFSFFSFGRDAVDVLRTLVESSADKQIRTSLLETREAGLDQLQAGSATPPVRHESVRATLSPMLSPIPGGSPRASGEFSRASMDNVRRRSGVFGQRTSHSPDPNSPRSASTSRVRKGSGHMQDTTSSVKQTTSSGSFVEPSATSSAWNDSSNASASQILSRSDVFQSPTIKRTPEPSTSKSKAKQDSEAPERVQVMPPSRSTTQMSMTEAPAFIPSAENRAESSNSLQDLVKGSLPIQKAAGFAGYLRRGSKKMSDLLASESMGYVEKVSGMWAGGRKHYGETPDPDSGEPEGIIEDEGAQGHGDRFRAHFALPPTEKLQATFFGYLHRVLPLYGKIYIGDRHFCFRSLLPGTKTRLILPLAHIENVTKERGFSGIRYAGLVIVIQAFEELFFEFSQTDVRDDCAITLLQSLDTIKYLQDSGVLSKEDPDDAKAAKEEHKMLQEARRQDRPEHDLQLPSAGVESESATAPSVLFDDPRASILNFKPTESLRITCLTIGSRGDVQPYIALCKGLLAEGHRVKIATHAEFEPWVRKHGIDFAAVEGDPAELMRICIENGMFTVSFLREASSKFRGWLDGLLTSSWVACQDSDVLIESPSAMGGIHIAEALGIPYFRAFTMPWTRTRAYPHAFAVPERKMGGAYNYMTYIMVDNVFWAGISKQINRWRIKELDLRATNLDKMHPNKVPFLYNFSPSVVVPPLDFSDWIRVTGYWFLNESELDGWEPPKDLAAFIAQARADGKKLVYIGFGSIVVSDPAAMTRTVVESVLKADVRCILSKGWSDRLGGADKTASVPEVPLPPEIFQIQSAPHDWLFPQVDAVAHHGGAGTTGASLRAGVPTIIKPFFGDQFFFGGRVEDLGVGICMKKLNTSAFSRSLWEATHSERMIVKARVLGEQIRKEDGVGAAIQAIYRDLEYAKTLIKGKSRNAASGAAGDADGEGDPFEEESWTFIGDESDPELIRRISEWKPPAALQQHRRAKTQPVGKSWGNALQGVDFGGDENSGTTSANESGSGGGIEKEIADGAEPDMGKPRRQRSAFSARMLGKAAWPKVK